MPTMIRDWIWAIFTLKFLWCQCAAHLGISASRVAFSYLEMNYYLSKINNKLISGSLVRDKRKPKKVKKTGEREREIDTRNNEENNSRCRYWISIYHIMWASQPAIAHMPFPAMKCLFLSRSPSPSRFSSEIININYCQHTACELNFAQILCDENEQWAPNI